MWLRPCKRDPLNLIRLIPAKGTREDNLLCAIETGHLWLVVNGALYLLLHLSDKHFFIH